MRVYVLWPVLMTLVSGVLLAIVLYQRSWIPNYQEAEPLFPVADEFGRELIKLSEDRIVTAADIENLILEEKFAPIQPYGIVFSRDPEYIVSIRINERHSFDIPQDGHPQWSKNN